MVAFGKPESVLGTVKDRTYKLSVILAEAVPEGTPVSDVWAAASLIVYEAMEQPTKTNR